MDSVDRFHLIPPEELRCVWMTAGVLAYQLCNRTLDCDNCPLDAAITRRFTSRVPGTEEEHAILAHAALLQIPEEGYHYSRNHWWARRVEGERVRLGIEADLAQALLAVKTIVFPSPGQRARKGQTCIWVVVEGGTLPLEAPLDGVVRKVNHDLVSKPHLLRLEPYGDGWLCELEADAPDAISEDLFTAGVARPKFAADRKRFLTSLDGARRGKRPAVGRTLADGGEKLRNFSEILGPSRYFAIVRRTYGWSRR